MFVFLASFIQFFARSRVLFFFVSGRYLNPIISDGVFMRLQREIVFIWK